MAPPSSSNEDRSAALAEMLARVALGDRAAFERLYRATSSALLGVIVRIQRDRAQAEDLLQDVFVNIWRAAQGFDATRAQPMTWLISIARHRAIDSLRRHKAEPSTVSSHGHDDDGDDTNLIDAMPSGWMFEAGDPASTPPELLGLFVGAPNTEASADENAELPPRIFLFQRNLERAAKDRAALREEIRVTLYHEIGHLLGFDEEGVAEMGLE